MLRRDGHYLFVKKSRGPYAGLLDLPGGEMEFGETPFEALAREVLEETGVTVRESVLLDVVTNQTQYVNSLGQSEDFFHLGVLYFVTDFSGHASPHGDGQDSLGAIWLREEECSFEAFTPFARTAFAYLQKKRAGRPALN